MHLQGMSDRQAKLYLYCLLRAKNQGRGKGTFSGFAVDIADELGWSRKILYTSLKSMGAYLEVKYPNSRHHPMVIKILKFKAMPDFYRTPGEDSKGDSKESYCAQNGNGNGTVKGFTVPESDTVTGQYRDSNLSKSNENGVLEPPNKGISKEVKKEGKKKEIPPVFLDAAEHLKKRVLETKQMKITDKTLEDWSDCVRLMISRDERTLEDIKKLIDECHDMEPSPRNGFTWRNNILSMQKLRKQWNDGNISIGMNKKGKSKNNSIDPAMEAKYGHLG